MLAASVGEQGALRVTTLSSEYDLRLCGISSSVKSNFFVLKNDHTSCITFFIKSENLNFLLLFIFFHYKIIRMKSKDSIILLLTYYDKS